MIFSPSFHRRWLIPSAPHQRARRRRMAAFDPPVRLDRSLGQPLVLDEPIEQQKRPNGQRNDEGGNKEICARYVHATWLRPGQDRAQKICSSSLYRLARIIHEHFCCNRGDESQNPMRYSFFAPRSCKGRSTSQARWRRTWTRSDRRLGRRARHSAGQHPVQGCLPPSRARLWSLPRPLLRDAASKVIDVWREENVAVSFPVGSTRGDFRKRLRHQPPFIWSETDSPDRWPGERDLGKYPEAPF
jgi:hypothetical protein